MLESVNYYVNIISMLVINIHKQDRKWLIAKMTDGENL